MIDFAADPTTTLPTTNECPVYTQATTADCATVGFSCMYYGKVGTRSSETKQKGLNLACNEARIEQTKSSFRLPSVFKFVILEGRCDVLK